MPLYEYKCNKCKHEFEKLKKFSEADSIVPCEKCAGPTQRLISKCFGWDASANPAEYEYTHKLKPKYVRDSKGRRTKFNPTTMGKGRKGSG